MRPPFRFALLVLALSCGDVPTPVPARHVDYTAPQHALFAVAPGTSSMGISIASPEHLVDRLKALRGLVETGPLGRKYVGQMVEEAKRMIGFDPIDLSGYRAQGIDPSKPAGLVRLEDDRFMLIVGVSDAAKATTFIERVFATSAPAVRCTQARSMLACGQGELKLAASETDSLWPKMAQKIGPELLSSELALYVALEKSAPKGEEIGDGPWATFAAQSQALFVGATVGEAELVVRGFYANPGGRALVPYLTPEPGAQELLGAAVGSRGVARVRFSPSALYRFAEGKLEPNQLSAASGGFEMATALDLKRDVIDNLSGVALTIALAGSDGGPHGAVLVGTKDDATSRRVAEKLDAFASQSLEAARRSMASSSWKIGHRVETIGRRPSYAYVLDVPAEEAKTLGFAHTELHLTTAPGALVFALGKGLVEHVASHLGSKPSAFIQGLRTFEAQAAFQGSAPLVWWGYPDSPLGGLTGPKAIALTALHPDAASGAKELSALIDLLDEAVATVDVGERGIGLFYQLSFL